MRRTLCHAISRARERTGEYVRRGKVAGRAIAEGQDRSALMGVALMMLVYLTFSLLTSAFMNWYNKKIKIVER